MEKMLYNGLMKIMMLIALVAIFIPTGVNQYQYPLSSPGELPEPLVELDPRELECLQKNVFFEARNQGRLGMKAVAAVTINRVNDQRFPDSVCKVVYQPYQFSWANRGDRQPRLSHPLEREAWELAGDIATQALQGTMSNPVGRAQFFHTIHLNPNWGRVQTITVIGDHVFKYKP